MALADSILQYGDRASQPAAAPENNGIYYRVTDEADIVEQSDGATWTQISGGGGSGTVTNTGTLTDHAVIVGNGGADVSALASLGTAGFVLTSAGAGADPAFAIAGMTLIEQQTPSGVTNIVFSSLGAFTHLQMLYTARGDTAATSVNLQLTFNADTGSNYDRQQVFGSATSAQATESLAAANAIVGLIAADSAPAGAAGSGTIRVYDYRGTTFQKTATAENTLRIGTSTGNVTMRLWGIDWRSTAAITSITLTLSAGNFAAGSKFTLYGLS